MPIFNSVTCASATTGRPMSSPRSASTTRARWRPRRNSSSRPRRAAPRPPSSRPTRRRPWRPATAPPIGTPTRSRRRANSRCSRSTTASATPSTGPWPSMRRRRHRFLSTPSTIMRSSCCARWCLFSKSPRRTSRTPRSCTRWRRRARRWSCLRAPRPLPRSPPRSKSLTATGPAASPCFTVSSIIRHPTRRRT